MLHSRGNLCGYKLQDLAPTKVNYAGSNTPECILVLVGTFACVKFEVRKARKPSELAKFDANRGA